MAKLSAKQREEIVAAVSEADRLTGQKMTELIHWAYFAMKSPSKIKLLQQYREQCDDSLPKYWLDHHCQVAQFAESIIA